MEIFSQLAQKIIKAQESVIGPIALEQAKKVGGLQLDNTTRTVVINGSEKEVIDDLIRQYEEVFGMASVEVCRDAVRDILPSIPNDQMPALLKN
jgi:hypothetical protein